MSFPEIKRKLEAMGEQELERWVVSLPLAPPVARALGLATTAAAPAQTADTPTGPAAEAPETARLFAVGTGDATQTWHHVQLLPGLVLQVNAGASAAVLRVAQRICEEFRARSS
jgi:hypothetical protein